MTQGCAVFVSNWFTLCNCALSLSLCLCISLFVSLCIGDWTQSLCAELPSQTSLVLLILRQGLAKVLSCLCWAHTYNLPASASWGSWDYRPGPSCLAVASHFRRLAGSSQGSQAAAGPSSSRLRWQMSPGVSLGCLGAYTFLTFSFRMGNCRSTPESPTTLAHTPRSLHLLGVVGRSWLQIMHGSW